LERGEAEEGQGGEIVNANGFNATTAPLRGGVTALEASAGSGKTHSISVLTGRLVAEAGLGIDEILIVTFTRAATASLATRLRGMFAAALASARGGTAVPETLAWLTPPLRTNRRETVARLERALRRFDAAAIFTIDGFCQRLLSEFVLASGASFGHEIVQRVDGELTAAAEDFWRRFLLGARGRLRAALAHRADLDPAKLERAAARTMAHPVLAFEPPWNAVAADRRAEIETAGDAITEGSCAEWAALVLSEFLSGLHENLEREHERLGVLTFDDLRRRTAAAIDGPDGPSIVLKLRNRFKVALIDEFQDTDPLQWRIFSRIFAEGSDEHALWLVGDPKQAIYGFRGADLSTYIAARNAANDTFPLPDNWRSEAPLVRAVNALFGKSPDPFLSHEITFLPAAAASPAERRPFVESGVRQPPFHVHFWQPCDALKSARILDEVSIATAGEIVRLLECGAFSPTDAAPEPLRPGDVAVLVQNHKQASAVERALRHAEVPAVRQSRDNVFRSEAADVMRRILAAAASPGNGRALRSAAVTPIMGWTPDRIAGSDSADAAWTGLSQQVREFASRCDTHGFLTAWRKLCLANGSLARVVAGPGGRRFWIDINHIAEWLAAEMLEHRIGRTALFDRFERICAEADPNPADESILRRLETDDDAVRIATIHASKGLEYPIVLCPFLFDAVDKPEPKAIPAVFRSTTQPGKVVASLFGENRPDGGPNLAPGAAYADEFAERVRLTYVALTRAEHRCHIVWGPVAKKKRGDPGAEASPLAWLLHGSKVDPNNPAAAPIAVANGLRDAGPAQFRAAVDTLAKDHPESFVVRSFDTAPARAVHRPLEAAEPAHPPGPRRLSHAVPRGRAVSSYSALIGEHRATAQEHIAAEPLPELFQAAPDTPAMQKFRGVEAGNVLHAIFEKLPLLADPASGRAKLVSEELVARGFDPAGLGEPVEAMVAKTLDCPLPAPGLPPTALSATPFRDWRSEIAFHLPLAGFTAERFIHAVAGAADAPAPDSWIADLASLGFGEIDGWLTGRIDLVLPRADRYWIVDWKSNRLGDSPVNYNQAAMLAEMRNAQYFLQAHLYALALHRRLKLRRPGYDYDAHFGGVYYLFVRGIDGSTEPDGSARGVYFLRPERGVIDRLEAAVLGHPSPTP
jgi:exodeoxyribonuclease V beta subunit